MPREKQQPIPPAYATELQVVMNALNDLKQKRVEWDAGTRGIGVVVSDSLMFQRGDPQPGDPHLSEVYGLALPLLKRGVPVAPVQLENVTIASYLKGFRVLLLTYRGMKPLTPAVHTALADWVKRGGALVVCDDDSDPYNAVREWWNSDGHHYATPREDLFEQLGVTVAASPDAKVAEWRPGKGSLFWLRENPASLARQKQGDSVVVEAVKRAAKSERLRWRETNYLLLRRGPYVIAAGLEESVAGDPKQLLGRFVNLFDPELRVQNTIEVKPGTRYFLRDLDTARSRKPGVLAAAGKALLRDQNAQTMTLTVEGVGKTPAVVLLRTARPPRSLSLAGQPLEKFNYSAAQNLLWIQFNQLPSPRELTIRF